MLFLKYSIFPHCQNYEFAGCPQSQTTCLQTKKRADGGIIVIAGKEDAAVAAVVFVEVIVVVVEVIVVVRWRHPRSNHGTTELPTMLPVCVVMEVPLVSPAVSFCGVRRFKKTWPLMQ